MTDITTTATPEARLAAAKAKIKANKKAKGKKVAAKAAPKKATAAKVDGPRPGSKVAQLIAAMRTAKGISTNEAAKKFDWETKSIRGVISGTIKAKLKLNIVTTIDDKRGNVYRIK